MKKKYYKIVIWLFKDVIILVESEMRLPNFYNLDINIINAYVNIKNIFPKKEIRDLIFVNKMINLLFRCIDKKITPIFQTIKIVMIFSDIIKRTKIFQYKFYFEN